MAPHFVSAGTQEKAIGAPNKETNAQKSSDRIGNLGGEASEIAEILGGRFTISRFDSMRITAIEFELSLPVKRHPQNR